MANYRSAMIYGPARAITDPDEKLAALRVVAEGMAPGQWQWHATPITRNWSPPL